MTYSKQELKKMFLRVLRECLEGKLKNYNPHVSDIVKNWINEYYDISLSEEEMMLTYEAVEELQNDGYLMKDPSQRAPGFLIFTTKGKELIAKQKDPEVHGLRLEELITNKELLHKCLNLFNDGDYETAIFSTYKFVEEKVRTISGASLGDIGVDLMTKALHPERGRLSIKACKLPAEQEGVYNLFKGSIAFFKNPSSHRTVNYEDRIVAIQIISFADLLLRILSLASRKDFQHKQ